MFIRSVRHPKVRKWKKLYSGEDSGSEYFISNHFRVIKKGQELGLLKEFVIHEKLLPYNRFEEMDRIWVTGEVADEIGMLTNWFGVLEKPKLAINRFNRILLLDNFHSSGELGTLIRSARCFGFDGILLTGGSVSLWDISVSRSAQDNLLVLPVVSLPFSDAIRLLREQQVSLVTIGKRKAVPAEELPLSDRMAILIPGSGNSSAYLVAASDIVCDPVLDCVDTAALAQAASILMYNCRNLRGE